MVPSLENKDCLYKLRMAMQPEGKLPKGNGRTKDSVPEGITNTKLYDLLDQVEHKENDAVLYRLARLRTLPAKTNDTSNAKNPTSML